MKVLVTGGAGFIGSHIADALLERGHDVTVFDNLSTGFLHNVPTAARVFEGDLRNVSDLAACFSDVRPEAVFHQAAQADVRVSVASPAMDAEVNVIGSLILFEACREFDARRVVFASTGGAIYGEQAAYPADESHPTRPVSPYGVAKLAVEAYLHYYAVEHGFRNTVLRYANVYGPRQNPHGEAGVVAIFSRRLVDGETPIVNGDGGQTRDYVYVDDVVRANIAALEENLEGIFNVGTGVETDVNRIFDLLNRAGGANVDAVHGPGKPGEQRRSCLDTSRLREAAGWRPLVDLEEGLGRTMEFFRRPVPA